MNPALSSLADKLHHAETVTAALFSDVIRDACQRLPALRRTKEFGRLEQLIQSGAWTEATLSLLALETPQWQLRHIFFEVDEWHCTLSRQRLLPDWLDEPVTACHADLSLAILSTLVGAKQTDTITAENGVATFSGADQPDHLTLCCDNFI